MVTVYKGWRNVVDLRHTLLKKGALVSTEARLACPVGIPNGPRGRIRTCNLSVLSGTPLLIGLHAEKLVLPVRVALTLYGV
jgi:hypothetical protein